MYCSKCGGMVPEGTSFCSACGQPVASAVAPVAGVPVTAPSTSVAMPQYTASIPQPQMLYAGFWLRFVAAIIDGLVLAVPGGFLLFLLFASALPSLIHGADPMTIALTFLPRFMLFGLIVLVGGWLYWALMESSAWQATLGKKALGLYVTDLAGNRATFGRTSGRFFAGRGIGSVPYLGGLYFLISCIMAGLTAKKQALHDMIASCLVLRKA